MFYTPIEPDYLTSLIIREVKLTVDEIVAVVAPKRHTKP